MSLYNLILGMDTDADSLLNMLGKSRDDFGRFRNAYIEKGEDCPPHIVIYTRCGGGNREYYQSVFEEMSMHPNFIGTEDDDFDDTYCAFNFSIPEQFSKGES